MNAPAIQPTITQRVRRFLAAQGAEVRPWAGLDETYAQLFSLLRRRREDPDFWGPLAELLQAVIDSLVDPQSRHRLAAPQAELLASWDTAQLVRDLRAALPQSGAEHDAAEPRRYRRQLTSKLSSAAGLGGFLVLGLVASGCADEANCDAEWSKSCALDCETVLYETIDDSQLTDGDKTVLCGCFADMSTSWSDGLTNLFENGTPEQISRALSTMLDCCTDPYMGIGSTYREDLLLDGSLCEPQPVYKGIALPLLKQRPRAGGLLSGGAARR